jgi:hypothetical protein
VVIDDRDDGVRISQDDAIIGRAFRWSLLVILAVGSAVFLGIWWGRDDAPVVQTAERGAIAAPPPLNQAAPEMPTVRFTDITQEAGLDFIHVSGARGEKLLPETMGAGVAFLDLEGDGDQDVLLVNSDLWPDDGSSPRPTMGLYRNDGTGRFTDVTAGSGLDVAFYGQGVAVGDVDNDGQTDVFLSSLGRNRMFRNLGGRFEDVTAVAGVGGADDAWSTSAGFLDFDNDGDLDLFVCNYVQWSRDLDLQLNFTLNGVDRAYGPPRLYGGTYSYLYRNEGDGTFTDVSGEAGIEVDNPVTGKPMGKALAVTFADADRDGFLDIFVANDTVQNFVFRNGGDGTFEEIGALSGVGFDEKGAATGAMGIDVADAVNNGGLGIGIGNFANESTSYYVQQGDPWLFVDRANAWGIGSLSRLKLSFGLFFFDYDLDGRLDLLQANGHLEEAINEVQPSQQYRQPAQLFWNCSRKARSCFAAVPESKTGDLSRAIVGRGAAYADIDSDGDLDVLLTQTGGRPLLARNNQRLGHHWLRVQLVGRFSNRDAIGAEIELVAGTNVQRRRVMPTRSYLSQVELPVTFGLGSEETVDSLTVHWPGGGIQDLPVLAVDTSILVEQDR